LQRKRKDSSVRANGTKVAVDHSPLASYPMILEYVHGRPVRSSIETHEGAGITFGMGTRTRIEGWCTWQQADLGEMQSR